MIDPIKRQIDDLLCQRNQVIVAIDGSCTSGKTTLATHLAEIYDCNVFHMDDFFLRRNSAQRSGMQKLVVMWIMNAFRRRYCFR